MSYFLYLSVPKLGYFDNSHSPVLFDNSCTFFYFRIEKILYLTEAIFHLENLLKRKDGGLSDRRFHNLTDTILHRIKNFLLLLW